MSSKAARHLPRPPSEPPPGTRVYAVGDIHGRCDLLDRRLNDIAGDQAARPAGRVVVVFVGDLVDRGPDSKGVVDRILAGPDPDGPLAGARFVALRGNHEDYLLQFLADFATVPGWLRNGGLETIRSYVGEVPDGVAHDHPALQRLFYRAMPASHLRFYSRMPLKHAEGGYLFVHAGIRPGVALERQDPFDLMWIREPFLGHAGPLPAVVVHGHTQVPEPQFHPHRIAIDTGAYRTGRLTCLVLEGTERRLLGG